MNAPHPSPAPAPPDAADVARRFDRDGYCVLHRLLPESLLSTALEAFKRCVRGFEGDLARQSMRREPNRFGQAGGLANPLMNIHAGPSAAIAPFRRAVEAIVCHAAVAGLLSRWCGRPCRAVQTLWLDESQNGPHQDAAYTDSVPPGQVVGLWVPLWEARGTAHNRFFVVPESVAAMIPHDADGLRSDRYVCDVRATVTERHGGRVVPLDLGLGDAVLFHSALIRGAVRGDSGRMPRIATHYAQEDVAYRALYLGGEVAVRDYGLALAKAAA